MCDASQEKKEEEIEIHIYIMKNIISMLPNYILMLRARTKKWHKNGNEQRERETLNIYIYIYTMKMEQDYNKYIVGVRMTE
jgi:hypothetical protein